MKCQWPFILENNFENISREGLLLILEKYSYKAITITLTGDYKKIYQRLVERNNSPERHRGHIVNDCYPEKKRNNNILPASYETFMAGIINRGMDSFVANGPHILLDTTDFSQIDRDDLLSKITKYQEEILIEIGG